MDQTQKLTTNLFSEIGQANFLIKKNIFFKMTILALRTKKISSQKVSSRENKSEIL